MSEPIPTIGVIDCEPNETTVHYLRRLLEQAESGELRGFVACCELTGGEVLTVDAGEISPFTMVGHMEFAKARIMVRRMEEPPDSEGGAL